MTYHPAIELYDFVNRHPGLLHNVEASYGTLDKHKEAGDFNMDRAKALLATNAKSAARILIDLHGGIGEAEYYRQTFRKRDVQDACASILLYDYVKGRRDH